MGAKTSYFLDHSSFKPFQTKKGKPSQTLITPFACFGKGLSVPWLTVALAAEARHGRHKNNRKNNNKWSKEDPMPTCCYSFSRQPCSSIKEKCQSVRRSQRHRARASALSQHCGNNSKRTLCRPGHDSLTNTLHNTHTGHTHTLKVPIATYE